MLETTKLSMAIVAAVLNRSNNLEALHNEFEECACGDFVLRSRAQVLPEALQTPIRYQRSFHHGQIPPKVLQAVRAAKECGEVRRIDQHDISSTLCIWRHPEQAVELRVARRGERMRTVEINGLARQQMH